MPKKHHIGFNHAWDGIIYALKTQKNFIFHTLIGVSALAMGIALQTTKTELLILCILFVLGVVVEMVNTAVESVVDLVTEEWHKDAKLAKDVSSGAMLVYAIGAGLIALMILIPRLISLFNPLTY